LIHNAQSRLLQVTNSDPEGSLRWTDKSAFGFQLQ